MLTLNLSNTVIVAGHGNIIASQAKAAPGPGRVALTHQKNVSYHRSSYDFQLQKTIIQLKKYQLYSYSSFSYRTSSAGYNNSYSKCREYLIELQKPIISVCFSPSTGDGITNIFFTVPADHGADHLAD
jgi:hypothetical protein